MAASLDKAHVEKKFKGVTTTQESIQSLSMWVMHHKAQHEKIVDIWFEVLKKCKFQTELFQTVSCQDLLTVSLFDCIIYSNVVDVVTSALLTCV